VDATRAEVLDTLEHESRVLFVEPDDAISSTAEVKEMMLDSGRPRGDVWENAVWRESVTVEDGELYLFQAIHQESDVVPENVDAIRAVTASEDAEESIETTNSTLGI
ncbi:MAG: glyceraldehyde-3-phosphate dehydrogenase, partial [Halobacteria archaeon]|nr:glyceraldehyde-3-phosphate dehydrogenase [Halobacteria archaeon]